MVGRMYGASFVIACAAHERVCKSLAPKARMTGRNPAARASRGLLSRLSAQARRHSHPFRAAGTAHAINLPAVEGMVWVADVGPGDGLRPRPKNTMTTCRWSARTCPMSMRTRYIYIYIYRHISQVITMPRYRGSSTRKAYLK